MPTHSSIPAWKIPWTEESGGLWSTGSPRVGKDWSDCTIISTSSSSNNILCLPHLAQGLENCAVEVCGNYPFFNHPKRPEFFQKLLNPNEWKKSQNTSHYFTVKMMLILPLSQVSFPKGESWFFSGNKEQAFCSSSSHLPYAPSHVTLFVVSSGWSFYCKKGVLTSL